MEGASDLCVVFLSNTDEKHHVSTNVFLVRTELKPINEYLYHCILQRTGHVVGLTGEHMPRKMLTAWVTHARKWGGKELNFERTRKKALINKNIPTYFSTWSD